MARRERTGERERELRPEEVWVPPLHVEPDEWARNNAVFRYRLLRRSGWLGRVYVAVVVLSILAAVASSLWENIPVLIGR